MTALLKNTYAQVYLAQGDLDKATASVNEAIALFQQMNSYRLGEAYLTLAAIELAQRQPAAACNMPLTPETSSRLSNIIATAKPS